MEGRLFTLVNAEHEDEVFGWGIEITEPDEREAVVFFREPDSRQISFGVHDSAEAALNCWTKVEPMTLMWH